MVQAGSLHHSGYDAPPMPSRAELNYRRAGVSSPKPLAPVGPRWYGKVGLLLLSVILLTFSFAPFGQFYLAWVGLVPWLLLVGSVRSQRAAFLWSWLGGVIFFTANMWWLAYVSGPGMIALMVVLGLYWGVAGVVIRGVGVLGRETGDGGPRIEDGAAAPAARSLLSSILRLPSSCAVTQVLLIPTVWVALEWLRGNWPLNGLPWLFLGHAQTPILAMCQIADAAGVYGVSFWVVAVNALVALFILNRLDGKRLVKPAVAVGALLVLVLGYGAWRMSQTDRLSPGPLVMVVQSNFPQSNTGEKGASAQELVDYHVANTDIALTQSPGVDLAVWSETMMPELNREARLLTQGWKARGHENYGAFLDETHRRLSELAARHRTGLLVGAIYDGVKYEGTREVPDRRNTAYFFDRNGVLSDDPADRYDKVHIVPFGEYLPFRETLPMLYRLFVALSPYDEGYFLTAGEEDAMTVFRLGRQPPRPATAPTTAIAPTTGAAPTTATASDGRAWRFVTPICFEDIDPLLVAKMFRAKGSPPGATGKAADFIVNITNDGWFKANQMPQHLQAARFRSIENRAPTARSVNTGISGFIDSFGRVYGLIPAGTEGTNVQRLQIDSRVTLYTRWGDLFALACAAVTCVVAGALIVRWSKGRRKQPTTE
jgi:apolipoprotein N-acyltransferase